MAGGERNYSYNGHLSDYSDDFEDEEPTATVIAKPAVPPVPIRPSPPPGPPQTKGGGTGAGKAMRGTPRNSQSLPPRRKILASDTKRLSKGGKPHSIKSYSQGGFSPRDRVISANKHALKTVQNQLANAKRELEEMRKENRLLNRLQVRQERELDRIQKQEGELPQILARHTEEVRSLKEQLHRSQETARTHHHRANELHQELLRLSDRKKKLEEVARKKHLLEREALTVELQEKNEKLDEKERRMLALRKNMEVMGKNHAQEVRQLRQRNKLLSLETEGLRNATQRMHTQIKEKDKVMDVMNIYTQRIARSMPQRTTGMFQVDSTAAQTEISCPPFKSVSLQSKPSMRARESQTEFREPRYRGVAAGTQTDSEPDEERERYSLRGIRTDGGVSSSGAGGITVQGRMPHDIALAPGNVSHEPQVRESHGLAKVQDQGLAERVKPATVESEAGAAAKVSVMNSGRGQAPRGMEDAPPEGAGETRQNEEEREKQKKEVLLARLRALDSQKDPPGSQPITLKKSTAERPVNVTVAAHCPPPVPPVSTTVGTSPGKKALESVPADPRSEPLPPPSQGLTAKSGTDAEEQQRKKLLLAKLMAIDEGNDPTKVALKSSRTDVSQPSQKHNARTTTGGPVGSANRSNTSLQSWPDTVDNMHKGRPAYSTEEDPFGRQFSGVGLGEIAPRRGSGSVRKEGGGATFLTDGSLGEGSLRQARANRRLPRGDIGAESESARPTNETKREAPDVNKGSYRPSHGRRAQPKAVQNNSILGELSTSEDPKWNASQTPMEGRPAAGRAYPWEIPVETSSSPSSLRRARRQTGSTTHVPEGVQNGKPGGLKSHAKPPLLPLRARVGSGFDVMPGAVAPEPDDIEELVL